MNERATWLALTLALGGAGLGAACGVGTWEPVTGTPAAGRNVTPAAGALKVHLLSGDVVVVDPWTLDDAGRVVRGEGTRYDVARQAVGTGPVALPYDSVALLEQRVRDVARPAGLTVMAVWTVWMGATTAICVADPKSCFGSCPTFYADDLDADRPVAEGFSASFARALEARDVDALFPVPPDRSRVTLRMANEALETHAVRHARLLAVPRQPGEKIFADAAGAFFRTRAAAPPSACRGPEGDCLDAVAGLDGRERRSWTDSTDLGARETVDLAFPAPALAPGQSLGLVVGARQAFVSTFLFYQTIAYFGRRAGEFLAELERQGEAMAPMATGMARALGDIEVLVPDGSGGWRVDGAYGEAGPIATDVAVIPISAPADPSQPVRIRLRMARGHWRIDQVSLAAIEPAGEPVVLEPTEVLTGGAPDAGALARLRRPDEYLVTYPGDEYQLVFDLPRGGSGFEVFLDTRGYYYEWSRREWLAEEDAEMAALALADPPAMLRKLAPAFKRVEPEMDRLFWHSRFGR